MKCISCIGNILALLLSLYLVDVSFSLRRNRHTRQSHNYRNCPHNSNCVELSRCRPGLLRYLGHPPINCGFTYHGKQRVCCPERSSSFPRTARQTSSRPITQEVLSTISIRSRNGQKDENGHQEQIHSRYSHQDCLSGTKCVELSRCRPGLLRYLENSTINCGFTYNGKQRVCCPERSSSFPRTARPTASRPITKEVLIATSIRSRNGQQDGNGQQERNHSRYSHQDCLSGTKCVEFSRCRPDLLRYLENPPKNCGFTYHGKQRVCCPEKRPPTPPFTPRSTPSGRITQKVTEETFTTPRAGRQECGKVNTLQGLETEIKSEKQGAWPWMVAIFMRDRYGVFAHKCSASMITRRHALSAAHCFKRKDPSLYVAKIGHVDRNLGYAYNISRIYVPDTYRRDQFYDDIAVLTLSRDVMLENVSPICLPLSFEFINLEGRGATAVGWGSTESDGSSSDLLRKLPDIPVISNWECNTLLTERVLGFRLQFPRGITDGFICAGFLEGGKDTCGGDSGGPLMDLQGDHWYVVGVVSFGVECAKPGFPGGYTRVSKYLKWIQQRIRT